MKGFVPLFVGIFGTFAFSWVGLTVIPNWQIGHLNPQMEEDGTDAYPMPQSGMVERGARVYAANGCIYCHSQQVRQQEHRGPCRRVASPRCTPPRGIMCIFIRRAASTSIRTCRLIIFFIKRVASVTRLRLMHCSSRVPMRRQKAGKLFLLSTRNVLLLI